eukprot:11195531-Lingulodinium_polyedra.AAC.1
MLVDLRPLAVDPAGAQPPKGSDHMMRPTCVLRVGRGHDQAERLPRAPLLAVGVGELQHAVVSPHAGLVRFGRGAE